MKLAYLTTKYPAVSHTFIRRELREIERRGHSVLRLAIRPPDHGVVDAIDQQELAKTCHFTSQPMRCWIWSLLRTICTRPGHLLRAFALAMRMGLRSERGILRHLAYLVEACYFLGVVRRERIEHVHVHFGTNPATVARLIRCLGGPSYSFTVHGPDEFDAAQSFDLRGNGENAEFVIAITDYCAAQLRRWVAFHAWPKIHVVHCTVGDEFLAEARPVSADSKTLVCVGRLCPQKAQLLLVEAMHEVVQSGVDGRLVLAGDGEMRTIIEDLIRRLGLEARIEITGWIDGNEVRKQILDARALVLPSFAEGLPMVIMEAFALRRPVVSTYVAGIPELVRPRETGWLVMPARVDKLAEAMAEAYQCRTEQLNDYGIAGQRLIEQHHRTRVETERLERLFQDTCSARQGNACSTRPSS